MTPLRIGTRGSPLALWQANHVAALLRPLAGSRPVELVEIQTSGDRIRDVPLSVLGGQGIFTKEIQRALLDGSVEIAVHSLKDLPTVAFEGLTLAAVPERAGSGDAFVSLRHARFDDLPTGATVATSSQRRRAQALYQRPDLRIVEVRGNVETRLRKLEDEGFDALLLAQAGLERLGLGDRIREILDPQWMLPAVGQGALGLECRSDDPTTRALLEPLNHGPTRQAVLAERALLRSLGGGCQVPIGAAGKVTNDVLTLRGVVLSVDGRQRIVDQVHGSASHAEALGQQLAERLRGAGATALLSA